MQAAYKTQGAAADEAAQAAQSLQTAALEQHSELRTLVTQLDAAATAAERQQRNQAALEALVLELRGALAGRAADLGDAEKGRLEWELRGAQARVDEGRHGEELARADSQLRGLRRDVEAKEAELKVCVTNVMLLIRRLLVSEYRTTAKFVSVWEVVRVPLIGQGFMCTI